MNSVAIFLETVAGGCVGTGQFWVLHIYFSLYTSDIYF